MLRVVLPGFAVSVDPTVGEPAIVGGLVMMFAGGVGVGAGAGAKPAGVPFPVGPS